MTIEDILKAINPYPMSHFLLTEIAMKRDLIISDIATVEKVNSKNYQLVTADIMMWLSTVPTISQGGQNYHIPEREKQDLKKRANAIYKLHNDSNYIPEVSFGYKGDKI